MSLRPRALVQLGRGLPTTVHLRFLSTGQIPEEAPEVKTASQQYEQACQQSERLEQRWLRSRKDSTNWSANSKVFGPSYLRDLRDHFGPSDMDVYGQAQRAVERQTKYAWVPCNYGAKFVLTAGFLYFSLDETKPYSGIYLISVARKRSGKTNEDSTAADKRSSFDFPYHERKVLFRADTFPEAIQLADALVEKMIKSKKLLASMERYAPWQNEPSTALQLNFLLRLGTKSREQDPIKSAVTMSKGEVCSIITDAVMKFERSPQPEATNDETDDSVVQEVSSSPDLYSNFMLSSGLWDLES